MMIEDDKNLIIQKGNPVPLGVSRCNGFINFAIFFGNVDDCTLNIYEPGEKDAIYTLKLDESYKCGGVFCVSIKGNALSGCEYDYTVMGNKVIDPYAVAITGRDIWGKPLYKEEQGLVRGKICVDKYNWKDDVNPCLTYDEMIMYKLHVRGYTMHQSSRLANKGTFKGLGAKIDYLKELGVNAVLLMPVYDFDEIAYDKYLVSTPNPKYVPYEEFVNMRNQETSDPVMEHYTVMKSRQGIIPYKINYWGYGAKSFYMAPKAAYSSNKDNPAKEYKDLIKKFHSNGIEVIMEMAFANDIGIHYIIDCLRYWVLEYHIDGFKISRNCVDIELIVKDPILSKTKIISENFDEYRVYGGEYVPDYKNLAIMNVEYMNCVRKYLKGDEEQVGDFSYKFRRLPYRTGIINYVTDSNGFTLNDLYSYDVKHNEANGEDNRDGNDYNHSWNCGAEGVTRKRKVINARNRQIGNVLTTLLLSQGTPMILAGDEFGNTQFGNNNPYCQDNEISWINWQNLRYNRKQFEFVKELIRFRKEHKVFHLSKEARLMDYISCGYPDMSYHGTRAWYPDYTNYSRTLGIMLCEKYCQVEDRNSYAQNKDVSDERSLGNIYYLAYNMHWEDHQFDLPKLPAFYSWKQIYNSTRDCFAMECSDEVLEKYHIVPARTIIVLKGEYDESLKEADKLKEATRLKETATQKHTARGKDETVQNKKCKKNDGRAVN